jgi:FtsP/CotA-like multicopper oxidase with cupredoxin domain
MHNPNKKNLIVQLLGVAAFTCTSLLSLTAHAAAPGITGPAFDLTADDAYITQPDGTSVYAWGYGCTTAPAAGRFVPDTIAGGSCPSMQLPGPTLIVTEGDTVIVTLTNALPPAAGNTSILFPGFDVTPTGGTPGLLTQEAANGGTVTYTFTASKAGTHTYYSGTQGDLQIEMGMYGALIVLPADVPSSCRATGTAINGDPDFRHAAAAFNHPSACYDREYLFQFSTIDALIHQQAEEQVAMDAGACDKSTGCLNVATEPYVPNYFMINGRSMPDDMDPNYALAYPRQPYNGNPHMHPGELVLLRVIGSTRWQHPFHEHGNHVRVLARDGNQLLTPSGLLAGPALFTTTTTPGQTIDGIFQWTAKGLNWDVYGHCVAGAPGTTGVCQDGVAHTAPCVPDADGYYTSNPAAPNYYEWCADHGKPLEDKPFGAVGGGGPVTLPDANIVANGPWYGGSPYLGPEATERAVGATPIPPSGTVANGDTAGFAFMWHSHNERELSTNGAFPGGMMMMMLVDPWVAEINEAN